VQDPHVVLERGHELVGQPGLAHPGVAQDRDELAPSVGGGAPAQMGEQVQLLVPSHHWTPRATGGHGAAGVHGAKAHRHHRFVEAFQVERRAGFGVHRAVDQPVGVGTQQDLARAGRLLQAGRHVHRAAQDVGGVVVPAHDHLARVDAGAHVDLHVPVTGELGVEGLQLVAHVVGGAHGPQGVVLVDRRHAEHGHHRVADELLHGAAVTFEHAPHLREVALHHAAERLRVEAFAERGGVDDVAEHDRHRPPRPPGSAPGRREGGATAWTEPSVIGRRRTAR
jgi:hypothetical protein